MDRLDILRRAYATRLLAAVNLRHDRIEDAFATVPREHYLGPGPWPILRDSAYVPSPDADPVYVYDDVLVGLDTEQRINNGQPAYHAKWIAALDPPLGGHAVHIGAGTGYYSAILAHLVGAAGRVTAIEYDAALAMRARDNLQPLGHVCVVHGDGTSLDFDTADAIYVNAGVTRPPDLWLDRLTQKGRLVVPLTTDKNFSRGTPGAFFLFSRHGDRFAARWLTGVFIFPCVGARDPASEAMLANAFEKGTCEFVRSLHRRGHSVPHERCWIWAEEWYLCYDEVL
jgi:protein-L-isoaspartate(D-aspartate) O-methyltransferase